MKYFVFSIDDGTIYDEQVISLFNKYGIRGTFNLNSGLDDFVWYLEELPIRRFILEEKKELYSNHEVASHSLTHPYLDMCIDEIVKKEINEDIDNLERIFKRKIVSFATPFDTCSEREVNLIKSNSSLSNIRLSEIDESFSFPKDPYHIKITALDIDRALELIHDFRSRKEDGLFIYAGHSYDFYVNNSFSKLEELLKILVSEGEEIKVLPIGEMVEEVYSKETEI